MSFDFALLFESIPRMLEGIGVTFQLLIYSSLLGLVLAFIVLMMRISGKWYLSAPAYAYIYVFRGTPILVQIFVIYYGLSQFTWLQEAGWVWDSVLKQPFWCCVIALSLNAGAYVSEIMRGGIIGVDKGTIEAAKALGIGIVDRFIYIISPIAIRLALPAYSNDMISMAKATSLASTVTLLDVTGVARTIQAETFSPYEVFIAAAVIYIVIAWLLQKGFGLLEQRMSRYVDAR